MTRPSPSTPQPSAPLPTLPAVGTLAQEIEAAKRAGIPATAAELNVPLPPPDQNAAPLYTRLVTLMSPQRMGKDDKVFADMASKPMPATTQYEEVRQTLVRQADALKLFHQAALRPQCVFNRNWVNPGAVQFPEFAKMRAAVRMLVAESLLMAHDGKPIEAVTNLALGFRAARHAAADAAIIAYLVAVALDTITLSGMQKILYVSGTDPRVAEAVRQTIDREWQPHRLAHTLGTEAAIEMGILEIVRRDGPRGFEAGDNTIFGLAPMRRPNTATVNAPEKWKTFIDLNEALVLRRLRLVAEVADKPYPAARPQVQAVKREADDDRDSLHVLAGMLNVSYDKVTLRQPTGAAQARVVSAGAAVLAWKTRHGSFPKTLSEAVIPVPADPFDGKPLRYRLEGEGFVVYSVGDGGTYDGGTPDRAPKAGEVVFRWPRPPYLAPGTVAGPK